MFGCSTETAEDGLEAVAAARERPFDLILMDIKMPRMDGLEATRAIRALPGAAAATPIVALTANGDPEQVASYLAAGMQAVVDKPIKPELLLNTLQRVLSGEAQETQRTTAAA
jgi:CheY-like chemotaxis protein